MQVCSVGCSLLGLISSISQFSVGMQQRYMHFFFLQWCLVDLFGVGGTTPESNRLKKGVELICPLSAPLHCTSIPLFEASDEQNNQEQSNTTYQRGLQKAKLKQVNQTPLERKERHMCLLLSN